LGRKIVEDHFKKCLDIKLGITGLNGEVGPAQWEYQIFGKGLAAADELVISRYILERLTEDYNVYIVWHPKPLQNGLWNGSGLHTNFSTKTIREAKDDLTEIYTAIGKLEAAHEEHMAVYGEDNELRLTGDCETSSFSRFKRSQTGGDRSCGDRSASCRVRNGYFEDRRPAANADPYLVSAAIYKTVCL
jgi:glutamine synthetase